jgi:hypothetical protein
MPFPTLLALALMLALKLRLLIRILALTLIWMWVLTLIRMTGRGAARGGHWIPLSLSLGTAPMVTTAIRLLPSR